MLTNVVEVRCLRIKVSKWPCFATSHTCGFHTSSRAESPTMPDEASIPARDGSNPCAQKSCDVNPRLITRQHLRLRPREAAAPSAPKPRPPAAGHAPLTPYLLLRTTPTYQAATELQLSASVSYCSLVHNFCYQIAVVCGASGAKLR